MVALVTPDTRARMIRGAAEMIGTRGMGAMTLRELAKEAGVPIGSTYHHFPGGRQQLIEEAIRTIGASITRRLAVGREHGPVAALNAFGEEWRTVLQGSAFRTGCPVFAVATADDEELRLVATEILDSWRTDLAEILVDAGIESGRAPRLALLIVGAVEGSIALCQAEKSILPLRDTMDELRNLVSVAVECG